MERPFVRAAAVVVLVACALVNPAFGTGFGARGDGDELDQRIGDASAKLRADRPWPGTVAAEKPVCLESWRPYASPRRNDWTFSLTPFFWAPALNGSQKIRGQEFDVDVGIVEGLENVFDNFQFAGMVQFEARKCRWGVIVDLLYVSIGNDDEIAVAGGAPIDLEWDTTTLTAQAMLAWRFAECPIGCRGPCFTPTITFDALAGARLFHIDGDVDRDPGPSTDGNQTWVDPVVGIRMLINVTPSLTFNVVADVGGFGLGSDLSWRLVAGAAWHLNRCVSLDLGWAVLDVDYEDGDFAYDVNQSGPYFGATFRF
jgi:hypothetical protein